MKSLEPNDKNRLVQSIIDILQDVESWQDVLEILANVFMYYGISIMFFEGAHHVEDVTPENVVKLVIEDMKERGNTIGNSLAMQGITILEWLDRKV